MDRKLAIRLRKFNRLCPITGYKEESIKIGAAVIVKTDRGEEFGTIVSFQKDAPISPSHDVHLKKVLRYATEEDMRTVSRLSEKDAEALKLSKEKAQEYELLIKIIDTEYLFETDKVNIYYKVLKGKKTPNLKPYRKDLSQNLKAEVTMRSITPRDEAKFLGGLGPCGRPLCCTKWLNKPRHITVKMVKEQGFQISPTRTAGMCGRLMCCFEYEEGGKEK